MLRSSLQDWHGPNRLECLLTHGPCPTLICWPVLCLGRLVHDVLPRPSRNLRISSGKICSCDLKVNSRLLLRFIFGMKESQRNLTIFGSQASLLPRYCVFAVISFPSQIEQESLFH